MKNDKITKGTVRDYIIDRAEVKGNWVQVKDKLLYDVVSESINLLSGQSEALGIPDLGDVIDDAYIDSSDCTPLADAVYEIVYDDYTRDEVICTSDWDGEDWDPWTASGVPSDVIETLADLCKENILYAVYRQLQEWHLEDRYPGTMLLEDLIDADDEDAIRSAWIRYIGRRVQYGVVSTLDEDYYEEYVREVMADHKPQCLCDLDQMTTEDLKAVDIDKLVEDAVRAVREYIDEDDED